METLPALAPAVGASPCCARCPHACPQAPSAPPAPALAGWLPDLALAALADLALDMLLSLVPGLGLLDSLLVLAEGIEPPGGE